MTSVRDLAQMDPIMDASGFCHPCGKRIRGSARRRTKHVLGHLAGELQTDFERRKEAA